MSITGSPNSDFRTQEHASGWAMYRPKRKFFRGFIKRRASLLILFLAFSFVLSLFYNLFFKPQYISSATVDLSGIFKDGESELAKINFFASRLKSEQFIETVLISHNLGNENNHKPFVITGEKIEAYRNSLRVSPLQETAFISIDVISESPELSKKIANAHAKTFVDLTNSEAVQKNQEAMDFLLNNSLFFQEALSEAEQRMLPGASIGEQISSRINEKKLETLSSFLANTKAEKIRLEQAIEYGTTELAQARPYLLPLSEARAEQEILSLSLGAKHPKMLVLDKKIARLESNFSTAKEQDKLALTTELEKQKSLQVKIEEAIKEAKNNHGIALKESALVKSSITTLKKASETVSDRLLELQLKDRQELMPAQVSEWASASISPIGLSKLGNTFLFLFIGAVLGIVLLVYKERKRLSFDSPYEVSRLLKTRTIGIIPKIDAASESRFPLKAGKAKLIPSSSSKGRGSSKGREKFLSFSQNESSLLADINTLANEESRGDLLKTKGPNSREAYRSLRTSLIAEGSPGIIAVTSALADEGKTTTARNLAASFAKAGFSTLFVDADMRKIPQTQLGFSDCLDNSSSLEEVICPTPLENLSHIGRGSVQKNPADLLQSPLAAKIFSELKIHYQCVLIDTPPVLAVSDSEIISGSGVKVSFVIHADKTPAQAAQLALSKLRLANAQIAGIVLNHLDPNECFFKELDCLYRYAA